MKKILSAVLAVILVLSLAPVAAAYKDDDDVAYPVEGGNIYIDEETKTVTDADESITAAVIPDGVVSIGDCAFNYCFSLTSVVIPDSVTSIRNSAFWYCSSLTSVVIPDSVTSIEEWAFGDCPKLKEITVDSGNPSYISKDGVLFTTDGKILHTYPVGKIGKTYTVPNGVASIGNEAFFGCTSLTSVVIPDSVTSIGDGAFYGCDGLTIVVIPDSVTSIGHDTFEGCDRLTRVVIPDSVTSIGDGAFSYLASKGIINGTSETTFSPDGAISRAEVAALLVRALGKLDNSAKSGFADVKTSDWFYATAASSEKCGLIKGYEDNTFRGNNQILKQETVTVVSRVLQNEMNYKVPSSPSTYLTRYSDTIPDWVKSDLALVTRENLLVYRVDGTFSGAKTFTRGDAAIVLYRLFQKIW